ncbi:hypothetical protein SAMN05421819_2998 [Bryocella elongata]|uniref:Uncharacterized protein n=1 Tax=Bryocella elongata TaxID=863522 RepID=A0A1H6AAH1_9BACT|nr:hypothetical protein [Bryocella elongata]SEG45057.1 hypothetical protein SAMN05421819_2998 [Bryocella elongata]
MTTPMRLEIDEGTMDLLVWNVANEVLNGFEVIDFESTIGISKDDFKSIVVSLRGLSKEARIMLDLKEVRLFRNALAVVLEELGIEEFDTRTGHSFEEGNAILGQLNLFIDTQVEGRA